MNTFLENLKREAEANPVAALAVGAAFLTALSKVIQANGQAAGSRAYARHVNAKLRATKK